MLPKDQKASASHHHCTEESETILLGSQNPCKNQLSCLTSLEVAQSSRKNCIMSGGTFGVQHLIRLKRKHQSITSGIFYGRTRFVCRWRDAHIICIIYRWRFQHKRKWRWNSLKRKLRHTHRANSKIWVHCQQLPSGKWGFHHRDSPCIRNGSLKVEGQNWFLIGCQRSLWKFQAKKPQLIRHIQKLKSLFSRFSFFEIKHVPREQNFRADILTKLATSKTSSFNRMII